MILSFIVALGASVRARRVRGLAYGSKDRQLLDVYTPVGADGEAPVVVFAHSGWPRLPGRRHFERVGHMLASRGLVTVIPDFQSDLGDDEPGLIDDVARATAWAKTHARRFGGDPERLFLAGHAGGAHIAAMLALQERWLTGAGLEPGDIRGVVGVSGAYDVSPALRPAACVTAEAPPMLLIAGGLDQCDPDRNTGGLARALRTVGGQVTEIRYPQMSDRVGLHSLSGALNFRANALDEVERFIRLHSLGAQARPSGRSAI